MKETFEIE